VRERLTYDDAKKYHCVKNNELLRWQKLQEEIKVWDIGVRAFHWSLVILFFIAYVSGEDEESVHIYSGYAVLALVIFRVVWGFIGTKYARFSDFIYGPHTVMQYARSVFSTKPLHYIGHNPLGGWMVVLLLLSLIGVSWSGLEVYGAEGHGPLAGDMIIAPAIADEGGHDSVKSGQEEFWEEIHEVFANFTLFLVILHISGAITASFIHRENLVRAMITGYKKDT